MRSVIELRLGPLASSLDKSEMLAAGARHRRSGDAVRPSFGCRSEGSYRSGSLQEEDVEGLTGSFSDGDGSAQFDMFGIEIPTGRVYKERPRVVTIAAKHPDELDLSALMC